MHAFGAHDEDGLRRVEQPDASPDARDPEPRCRLATSLHSRIVIHSLHECPKMQPSSGSLQRLVWRTGHNGPILPRMLTKLTTLLLLVVVLLSVAAFRQSAAPPRLAPDYTSDGQLKFPENYREWIYLTS